MASVSSGDIFCTYNHFILAPLVIIITIFASYPIYKFVSAYQQGQLKATKSLFISSITFFAMFLVYYMVSLLYYIFACINTRICDALNHVMVNLYVIQNLLFAAMFFTRLEFIFQNTEFRISRCTIIGFSICGIIIAVMVIIGDIVAQFAMLKGAVIITLGGVSYIFLILSLNALFINKLMSVYKYSKRAKLLHLITKTSILCFTFTCCTVTFLVLYTLRDTVASPHYYLFMRLFLIPGTFMSFLCLILTFSHFNPWYMRGCGYLDRKCRFFWWNCMRKEEQVPEMTIETPTSPQTPVSPVSSD